METPETPDWDLFERLEKVEELEPTVKDVAILAKYAFTLGFYVLANNYSNPRKLKDNWIAYLRQQGVSAKTLAGLETWLLKLCETTEERRAKLKQGGKE